MTALTWLVPVALALGGLGLAAFLWSLRTGQYDDLEGAGWRALEDAPPGKGGPAAVGEALSTTAEHQGSMHP